MLDKLIAECTDYDFKENVETEKPKSWLKSVSAFANGAGGTLLFGIKDNAEVIGLADIRVASDKISELINSRITPTPVYALTPMKEDGLDILLVNVKPGISTPYYYKHDGICQAYVRSGNETIEAPLYLLNELILKGTGKTYDSVVTGYKFEDFSFSILTSDFYEKTGTKFTRQDFVSFGLVTDKGYLTNAGLLFADSNPCRHSRIFCTRWNGNDKISEQEVLDDKEFNGSLIKQLHEAISFFRTNTKVAWHKEPTGTVYEPEYNEEAITEALVNGIIHRDYNNLGSEVCLNIYNDRIEITSPGGSFNGQKIPEHVDVMMESTRRNPILADLFWRMKYMNRRGSGLANITAKTNALFTDGRNDHVRYKVTPYSFWVIIDNAKHCVPELPEGLNDFEHKLLSYLQENENATLDDIMKVTKLSKSQTSQKIFDMKRNGLIENIGTTRKNIWVIK